jgi:hypothetical protein
MAEQIKFGDRLFLKGAKVFLDSGPTDNAILETRSGTVEIAGNLVVQGSTTTVNSETVSIADPVMLLNGDLTNTDTPDDKVGIEINRGIEDNKQFAWLETSGNWSTFGEDLSIGAMTGTDITLTGALVGDVHSENGIKIIDVTGDGTVDINGGNIDATVIGATTPLQATFTDATVTGDLDVRGSFLTITTDELTEGLTNKYFSNDRARQAISVAGGGSLTYDNATGIISFTGQYYSDADARQAISVVGNEIAYDNGTGVISYDAPTDFGLLTDPNVISGSTGGSAGSSVPTNVGSFLNDAGYLINVVEDTTPALGGDLDINNFKIYTTENDNYIKVNYDLASDGSHGMAFNAVSNMNFFVDPNNAGSTSYFGFYAKKNPDTHTINQSNSIFNINQNGDVRITGNILGATTDNLVEGSNNHYYSDNRVKTYLANQTGGMWPSQDNTYDIGSPNYQWKTIYGHTVEATYADLAERYETDAEYEPGTVVIFGGEKEITTTDVNTDYRVAGVISTDPGLKLNSSAGDDKTHPYLALRGRVPCKVIGPVAKGDLLVTSDTPGYARSVGGNLTTAGSVFAKSLTQDMSEGAKVIEVVII